jgi:plastocyanin
MLGGPFLARGQDVTVTARVKVVQRESQTEAAHAENVVVWLSPIGPASEIHAGPKQPLRLTQHNKSFDPHVLVVPVGSVVQFPNRDPFFHNVFSLFEGKRFDLGLYEAGTTRNVSFDRLGVLRISASAAATAAHKNKYGMDYEPATPDSPGYEQHP